MQMRYELDPEYVKGVEIRPLKKGKQYGEALKATGSMNFSAGIWYFIYPMGDRFSGEQNLNNLTIEEGIEFLGFVVLPDRLRLNARNVRRMRRRLKFLRNAYSKGDIEWPTVETSLQAWNAHASHGDTWQLRGNVYSRAVFSKKTGADPANMCLTPEGIPPRFKPTVRGRVAVTPDDGISFRQLPGVEQASLERIDQ